MLSLTQLDQYLNDGFLVLGDFVESHSCDALRARANELVAEFDPADVVSIFSTNEQNRIADDYFMESSDKIRFFFEENAFNPDGTLKQPKEQSINKIGHGLHDCDSLFDRFSRDPKIKGLISDLGLTNPLLTQSMYIFKQPNIGGEVSCHQDSTFLFTEPNAIVGLWFALEDATLENGCLWAVRGGHREGLKSRWVRSPDGGMKFINLNTKDWAMDRLAPLEVAKGTLIVLHGLLPHLSRQNKSKRSRHAYTLHVISGDVDYAEDNWLQRSSDFPARGF
jgi:phytanoyl-CoA hydroxylase